MYRLVFCLVLVACLFASVSQAQYVTTIYPSYPSYSTCPSYPSYSTIVTTPCYPLVPSVICAPVMHWHSGYYTKECRTCEVNVVRGGYWTEEPGIVCSHGNQGPPTRIWHPEQCVKELRTCYVDVWHEGYWAY